MAHANTPIPDQDNINSTMFGDSAPLGVNSQGLTLQSHQGRSRNDDVNFGGFLWNDRPGSRALSHIAPPDSFRGQFIVSDSRAQPEYLGVTQRGLPLSNVNEPILAQPNGERKVGPRLTSTLRSANNVQQHQPNRIDSLERMLENNPRNYEAKPKILVKPNVSTGRIGGLLAGRDSTYRQGENPNPDLTQDSRQGRGRGRGRTLIQELLQSSHQRPSGVGRGRGQRSGRTQGRGDSQLGQRDQVQSLGLGRGMNARHEQANIDGVQTRGQDVSQGVTPNLILPPPMRSDRRTDQDGRTDRGRTPPLITPFHNQTQARNHNLSNETVSESSMRWIDRAIRGSSNNASLSNFDVNQIGINQGEGNFDSDSDEVGSQRSWDDSEYYRPPGPQYHWNHQSDDSTIHSWEQDASLHSRHQSQTSRQLNASFQSIVQPIRGQDHQQVILPDLNQNRPEDRLLNLQRNVNNQRRRRAQTRNDANGFPDVPVYDPDISDHRRRLGTEINIMMNNIRRIVQDIEQTTSQIDSLLLQNSYEYSHIDFMFVKLSGQIEVLTRLQDRAAPYGILEENAVLDELLFEVSTKRPEWDALLSTLNSIKSNFERNLTQNANNNTTQKAVKVSYSEFPIFDGTTDFEDWWSRWCELQQASKLDRTHLTIKLRESIVGAAEENVGRSKMTRGSFEEILGKLREVYSSPIGSRQNTAVEFFNIKLDSEATSDVRRMVTNAQNALDRVRRSDMGIEALMANLLLANMPERLRDKMVSQINSTCPSYNMNMTTFNQAFTLATQSQKQKTPQGSIYSNTVNNNIRKNQVKY